jgi:hypothetical protein
LYSSAIFIGWGAVVLGIILERFYRDGIGTVVASLIGFSTLIIAHNLAIGGNLTSGGGDTMIMLRAVLDTNFWLWTTCRCCHDWLCLHLCRGRAGYHLFGARAVPSTLSQPNGEGAWSNGLRHYLLRHVI